MAGEGPVGGRDGDLFSDLDAIDLDAVDLDLVADEGPTTGERLRAWLDAHGVTAFVRRHRALTAVGAAAALVVVAAGGWWWTTNRSALPEPPGVTASVAAAEPALAELSPDGQATQVQQQIDLAVDDAADLGIAVLGLTGPGLGQVEGLPIFVADLDNPGTPVPARGSLSCGTTAQTAALAEARDVDYRVTVRRATREGATAVDSLPLVGAGRLLDLVRSTCLQRAADRDLRITGMSVTPVHGAAAVHLAIQVRSTGTDTWTSLQVADAARPALVPVGEPVTVVGGQPAVLHADLRPSDCSDPGSVASSGVLLTASPPGAAPPGGTEPPVTLQLPTGLQAAVIDQVRALCGGSSAAVHVASAIMRTGSAAGTGGTLDLQVDVDTRGSSAVQLLPSTTAAGRVTPQLQTPASGAHLGPTRVTWELPPCAALVDSGLPRLHVEVTARGADGPVQLPFLVPLAGDDLGVALSRLCPDVAPEIHAIP